MDNNYKIFLDKIQKGLNKLSKDDLEKMPEDVKEHIDYIKTFTKDNPDAEEEPNQKSDSSS